MAILAANTVLRESQRTAAGMKMSAVPGSRTIAWTKGHFIARFPSMVNRVCPTIGSTIAAQISYSPFMVSEYFEGVATIE